jgi:hypothetical protein
MATASCGYSGQQGVAETLLLGDTVVGVERDHDALPWVGTAQSHRRQAQAGRSAAWGRLDQDILYRYLGQLLVSKPRVVRPSEDIESLGGREGKNATDSLLQHRALADKVEQLLGAPLAAARP